MEEIELAIERFDERWQRLCDEPADQDEVLNYSRSDEENMAKNTLKREAGIEPVMTSVQRPARRLTARARPRAPRGSRRSD